MLPQSKIIQIAATPETSYNVASIVVLCEDGSLWERWIEEETSEIVWACILEAPVKTSSTLPEVGSKWRMKEDNKLQVEVISVGELISYSICRTNVSTTRILSDFLHSFEPMPQQ